MNETIKQRIDAVRRGEVPEGYATERAMLYPLDWGEPTAINAVLTENKDRNEDLAYGVEDVLSVSGEQGVVNQIELLGRSYAGESVAPYHIVETGDIVYTKSPLKNNPYGIVKQNRGKPGIVSTLYAVYHCDSPTTGQYLENYFCIDTFLNNYLKPLVKRGAKNDMKVNNEEVLLGRITLPPFQEQVCINEIIAQFDRVIELKQQLLAEKRKQKQWLMQMLLDPESGVRLPGFENSIWTEHKLEDLGVTYSGLSGKSEDDFGEGVPYIPYTNIFNNPVVDTNSFEYVSVAENEKQSRVQYGDMFFTTSSETPVEIGMSSVYLGPDQELYLNSFCFGFRLNNFDTIIPEYAAYCFRGESLRKLMYKLAQGATRYNLSKSDFVKQTITLPPTKEEQKAIFNVIMTSERAVSTYEKELEAWQQKKKALMQLLLTGLVRVNA